MAIGLSTVPSRREKPLAVVEEGGRAGGRSPESSRSLADALPRGCEDFGDPRGFGDHQCATIFGDTGGFDGYNVNPRSSGSTLASM